MHTILWNDIVSLRPATLADREKIFLWLTRSDLTKAMMGPPRFPDNPVPSWHDFINDYFDYFFDGSQPLKGQCFVIEKNKEDIGQINHNEIDLEDKSTEIDIWLNDSKHAGRGYGTEAIKLMCNYLEKKFDCRKIYIAPSGRNTNAIKSYQKAGFTATGNYPVNFIPDYKDTVVMVKVSATDEQSV